ncbi:MAG TPA: hypothetical protein VF832_09220, partial [Longimicrobiales bacterium]
MSEAGQPSRGTPGAAEVVERGAAPAGAAPSRSGSQGGARLEIRPVAGKQELKLFKRLPWRIYRDDPVWVPPLMMDLNTVVDGKHPFHQHAEVAYFMAWRGDRPVARVAAIVNRAHNDFSGDKLGFFGLFEAEEDVEAVKALLATAERWLKERGMDSVQGPMNLSTNEELCSPGLQLDGFDRPQMVMMTHTRPYYPALVEAAGYGKAKDLLAYWLKDGTPPQRLVNGVARLQRAEGVVLRSINMKDFQAEVDRVKAIYNSAWEQN